MKREFSIKTKWAVGLLFFVAFASFMSDIASLSSTTATYGLMFHLMTVLQLLPTVAAVVLVFYDHKYTAPRAGNFTLLRLWSMLLIWISPVVNWIGYLSLGTDNITDTMWGGN